MNMDNGELNRRPLNYEKYKLIIKHDENGKMIIPDKETLKQYEYKDRNRLILEFHTFMKADRTKLMGKIFVDTGEIETKIINDSPYY